MKTIDPSAKLGDLVEESPGRARIFDALGIDYCCAGQRTLAEAAHTAGRPVDEIAALLRAIDDSVISRAATDGRDSRSHARLTPAELLDDIVATHHEFLRREMPPLLDLGRKVRMVHGNHHPELVGIVADAEQLWAELEPHLDDEEQRVFPALKTALTTGDASRVDLADIRAQHEDAGVLLERLRAASAGYTVPADACGSYQRFYTGLAEIDADTRRHIHKENNVVFPAVPQPDGVTVQ